MTRDEAIAVIKAIQRGEGVDRSQFPDEMKGNIARKHWNDGLFTLGIEYGAMIVLMRTFDIRLEDLA